MITTTVTLEGNLATDPELRFTPKGSQLLELRVLVNERRQEAGEWVDAEPTRHRVVVFGDMGTHAADSLAKGDRVLVVGRLVTESWSDRQTGEKRTGTKVLADAVAVSLRWATAAPTRASRPPQPDPEPTDPEPTDPQ